MSRLNPRENHRKNSARYENGTDNMIDEKTLQEKLSLFDFHTPLPKKRDSICRLFYNNCNGISINNTINTHLQQKKQKTKLKYIKDIEVPTKLHKLIRQMQEWEVDVTCLAEFNTAWEDRIPRKIVRDITKRYDKSGCWTVSTSAISVRNFVKPGGTAVLTMNEFSSKLVSRGTDPWKLGRWSYIIIEGKRDRLLIITGYRVGKRSGNAGPTTSWSQQKTLVTKAKRKEEPHTAFLQDLHTWMEPYVKGGHKMFISLDANEQWTDGSDIKAFATTMQLNNVNSIYNLPNTHPNVLDTERSTNIDYCFCCNKVLKHITYASLVPYELETLGDHRGMIVDIDVKMLLGTSNNAKESYHRKLTTTNTRALENYLNIVEERFQQQNIYERVQRLFTRVLTGHTDIHNIKSKYEQLDTAIHGICTKAEKRCRPTIAGKYEWSPKLAYGIKELMYWRKRLYSNGQTLPIVNMGKELQIKYDDLSQSEIQKKIKESRNKLNDIQTNEIKIRQEHLQDLATNYAKQNNVSRNNAINELMAHEGVRGTFATLKERLKQNNTGQLDSLWISMDEHGNYTKNSQSKEVYTDEQSVHTKILQRNQSHLQQASNTPFASGKLKKGLKWDGTGKLSDQILNGEILNDQQFRANMQLYLESLQTRDFRKLDVINPTLTLEEYGQF